MAGRGIFIVSLDCEGKWGMADRITAHHDRFLTEANLVRAYRRLLDLFAAYDMPASFAFVLGFTLTASERLRFADRFADVPVDGRNWLHHYRQAEAAGDTDGWFCPQALDMVRAGGRHEVACHGFSHLPLAEDSVSRAAAQFELESCRLAAAAKGLDLKTFVYPRNRIGHLAELAASGFAGYRAARPQRLPGALRSLASLASEFDLATPAQPPAGRSHGMTIIPSGYFLNWQRGLRRIVPRAVSRARWRHVLNDACRSGGVAHVWLHPHNLIDGPGTLERLEDVLTEAARLRDRGLLEVMTQADYCAAYGDRETSKRA